MACTLRFALQLAHACPRPPPLSVASERKQLLTRDQKITLGEMRSSGFAASWFIVLTISARTRYASALIDGRPIFGWMIWSRYSPVRRVAEGVPTSGPTLIGTGQGPPPPLPARAHQTPRHRFLPR